MSPPVPKPLHWIGSSKRDYLGFPESVQDDMGYALYLAQVGDKATPRHDREVVRARYRAAAEHYQTQKKGR